MKWHDGIRQQSWINVPREVPGPDVRRSDDGREVVLDQLENGAAIRFKTEKQTHVWAEYSHVVDLDDVC